MNNTIRTYIDSHTDRFIGELSTLLRIPSISSDPQHQSDMYQCCEQWCKLLKQKGVEKTQIYDTAGHPIVYAEKIIDPALPTILIYGHYDVMPVDPIEGWDSDPFEPVIKDGKIIARGADDDKGQSFMHLLALEYLIKHDLLKSNIKFLLEGEEEISSPNLEQFCISNKALLGCDTILVSDTSMISAETPSITTGLRGLAYWQIELSSANRDLHSGIFGGAVANPAIALCKLLASVINEDGKITIPHFYDDVKEISEQEKQLIAQTPFDEEQYKQRLGVKRLTGETGYSTIERTGIRPTFDVCGIWSGFTGEGTKTVLPAKAYAKISSRLVPDQHPETIGKLVAKHLYSQAPATIDIHVEYLHGADSYVYPIDQKEYKAAENAYASVFGKQPVPVRRGGSIGVVPMFEKILNTKPLLMGFGLEEDATHSPNENFPIWLFKNGIETIIRFYIEYYKQ